MMGMSDDGTITLADGRVVVAGEIIQYNGRECKVARNGALLDTERHRFVTPPIPSLSGLEPVRTSEQARELNRVRWHGPRQAAAIAAVQEASGNGTLNTIELADAYMVQAIISEVVLDVDTPGRDRVSAWREVLKQSGMDGSDPPASAGSGAGAPGLALSNEIAHRLLDVIEQAQQTRQQVIDTRSPNE